MILTTERTLLRPLSTVDFDIVYRCGSDPEIIKYMLWGPYDEEKTARFLKKCEEDWAAEPVMKYEFAVILKETGSDAESEADGGTSIGCCWLHLEDNRHTGELGWVLHSDYWNKGLMSEAAGALLRFGFEELRLHRLYAHACADNHGSYKIMEKFKMRREGHYKKCDSVRFTEQAAWADVYLYAILEEEYLNA